jgi:hypothetical protein
MHFDCACVSDRLAASSLAGLARGRRLLYGTNYTPDSEADIDADGCVGELAKTMGVDRAAVEDTMARTARDLFPGLS